MVNYQNGKIYKLISPSTGLTYYGSTVEKLCDRMAKHRAKFKTDKGNKSAFKVLACGDAKIYLVEKYPCDSKEELRAREGYYQLNFECVNYLIAGRTKQQYREDNKERHKEWDRNYYIANKERLIKQQSIYNKTSPKCMKRRSVTFMCECGSTIKYEHMPRHQKTKIHQQYMLNPFSHM